jgi:hypothetical protein
MEPRRIPEHLVKELVWGFVEENEPEKAPSELTTATSISPTTDWVSEYSGGASGRIWGRVVDATVTPTVKDLVTEHIEKVKVTLWQTTNLVIEESGSTLSKEQIVGSTAGANQTSFSTTTATTRVAEVPKDYRVFGRLDVDISFEDLHWSYYLLIGFACLAFLVCLAQGLTCLYISLARQKSSSGLKEVKVVCGKKSSKGSLNS